jgi:hypothetical protein
MADGFPKRGRAYAGAGGHPHGLGVSRPTGGLLDPSTHRALFQAKSGHDQTRDLLAKLNEGLLQADTVVRSASNFLTFGLADNGEAALEAAFTPGRSGGFRKRYEAALAQQKARDAYDTQHRRVAQLTGDTLGVGMGLDGAGLVPGLLKESSALRTAERLKGAAKITPREAAVLLGGGGVAGVAGQVASDALTGHRSSLGDISGAGVGGIVGAAALPFVPRQSAAIDAAATSAAQDLFNRRQVSLKRAAHNAVLGAAVGEVGGVVGQKWSEGLSVKAKGKLGQALGDLRSRVNGTPRAAGGQHRDYLEDTRRFYWMPDGRSGDLRFEDKFGTSAKLSPNQRRAREVLGEDFRLNHFLPSDIGKAASIPAASAGTGLSDPSRR